MHTIDCPQCHAQFNVPAEAIRPEGRTLRCSACGHKWLYIPHDGHEAAKPETPEDVQISDQPVDDGDTGLSFLRGGEHDQDNDSFAQAMKAAKGKIPSPEEVAATLAGYKRARIAGYAAAAVTGILVLAFLSVLQGTIVRIWPQSQAAYSLFGVEPVAVQPPLVMNDIKVNMDGTALTVTGQLQNVSTMERIVPSIRVALDLNDQKSPNPSWVFRPDARYIKAGEQIPFAVSRTLQAALPNVRNAVLSFAD